MGDRLEPGYKNFSELVVSKKEYESEDNPTELVGRGTEWVVYKYKDKKNPGQHIAYKVLCRDVDNRKFYKQLFRELDITNRARHPCTIEFLSFDLSDIEKPVVVNKFYEHGSLQDNFGRYGFNSKYAKWGGMKSSPNGLDNKIEVINGTIYTILSYGIARGVQYLHKLKIFHRDLRPANILIDENYYPHIIGFSKITEDEPEIAVQACPPFYRAPEIFRGFKFSFPADIFALAIIFYSITECKEIMTFKFNMSDRKKLFAIYNAYTNGIMPKMADNNPLQEIIKKMLSPDPKSRPKIEEVCVYLEDEKHWFENTDKKAFYKYKKEIDDFEKEQIPKIKDINIQISDQESNLRNKNKLTKKTKKKESSDNKYGKIQLLLEECSNSNSEAECALGSIFYTGYKGISKDYVNALRYFKKSKKHGYLQANIFIQSILNEIIQYERENMNEYFLDPTLYIEDENDPIFLKIRDKRSQLIYGMVQESNNNYEQSMNLYLQSCKQGSQEAKSRIGILLLKTNTFLDKSEKLLEETSRWRNKEENDEKYSINEDERKLSLLNLGILKLNKNDIEESIKIFEQLYIEDHPDAALLLGISYEKKGVNDKALYFYERSYTEFSNERAKEIYSKLESYS